MLEEPYLHTNTEIWCKTFAIPLPLPFPQNLCPKYVFHQQVTPSFLKYMGSLKFTNLTPFIFQRYPNASYKMAL